jgi:hypothetical protein
MGAPASISRSQTTVGAQGGQVAPVGGARKEYELLVTNYAFKPSDAYVEEE